MPPVRFIVLGAGAMTLLVWYLMVQPSTGPGPRFEYNLERTR
jgi:hypothetical protein